MYNDKQVYQEYGEAKSAARSNSNYSVTLSPIHKVIIDLKPEYICQVDAKFGLDLIKIKRDCWNAQCYGIVDSHLYEVYSRHIFRQNSMIEFNISDMNNISGKDVYELVFMNTGGKQINNSFFVLLLNLTKKYIVLNVADIAFDLAKYDGMYDIIDNSVVVFTKPLPSPVEVVVNE